MIKYKDYNKKDREKFVKCYHCMVHAQDIIEGYFNEEEAVRINRDLLTIVGIIIANKTNKPIIKNYIETWAYMGAVCKSYEQFRAIVMED